MRDISRSVDTTWNAPGETPFPEPCTLSVFGSHQLKPLHNKPIALVEQVPGWIPGILLLGIILVAFGRFFYPKRMSQILMAPFSRRNMNFLLKEGDIFRERITLALGLVYLLNFSVILFYANEIIFNKNPLFINPIRLYLLFILLIALFWLVKSGVIRLLDTVFQTHATTREYLVNMLVYNLFNGVVLLPLLLLFFYLPARSFFWISTGMIAIMFVLRFFRSFLIGLSLRKFSYLFLFVYLCTLEILPLLFLMKVVLNFAEMKR